MSIVLKVYRECGITEFPINCFEILKHYSFKIYTYDEIKNLRPELFLLCHNYSDDCFSWNGIIGYNSRVNERRILFSLMHELGHHFLEEQDEMMCDLFASYILAPRILIHKFHCYNAQHIHDIFGVSYAAANRAWSDYQNWFNSIAHTTHKPLDIDLQLEAMFSNNIPIHSRTEGAQNQKKGYVSKRKRLIKERQEFFDELRLIYGNDRVEEFLENQRIYGNDL